MANPRRPWRPGSVLPPAVLLPLACALAVLAASGCAWRPALTVRARAPARLLGRRRAPPQRAASRLPRAAFSEADLSQEQQAMLEEFLQTQVTDEEALRKERLFPLSEEELIRRAKLYLALNQGLVTAPELLAEDFEFCGPIVGPLGKAKYIEQLKGFNFPGAFPDAVSEWHDFRVDPFEPNRVWFTSRGRGTNTGVAPPLVSEPTGKTFQNPPQACSLRFNEAGEATQYTIGYVMDRRAGNTGGLGGLMGILWAIGKPFPYPESQPYQKSWQRQTFEGIVEFLAQFTK